MIKAEPKVSNNSVYGTLAADDFLACFDGSKYFGNWIAYDKDTKRDRAKKLKSHIESDDYFGTLATIVDLMLQEKSKMESRQNELLRSLRDDLLFLQESYKIQKKF